MQIHSPQPGENNTETINESQGISEIEGYFFNDDSAHWRPNFLIDKPTEVLIRLSLDEFLFTNNTMKTLQRFTQIQTNVSKYNIQLQTR